jgi:hypothetical protein
LIPSAREWAELFFRVIFTKWLLTFNVGPPKNTVMVMVTVTEDIPLKKDQQLEPVLEQKQPQQLKQLQQLQP